MVYNDCWVTAVDDVRKAFDNVSIGQTLEIHREYLTGRLSEQIEPDDHHKFLDLIETVLRGDDSSRNVGIDQGNPYSPTALDVLLQSMHDQPFHANGALWYRYADNLAYVAHSVSEGQRMLADAGNLLIRPMVLKGDPGTAIIDLNSGQSTQLLGLVIRKPGDLLSYSPSDNAMDQLKQALEKTHEQPNPPETATAAVGGWVDAWGMTFEEVEPLQDTILTVAQEYGFREEITPENVYARWRESQRRWLRYRREAFVCYGLL